MCKKCSKCGNYTLDYNPNIDLWECVKSDCGNREPKKEGETNSHIISVFES